MKKNVKDALILTLITLISGVSLGAVHEITKNPIKQAREKATQDAYRNVFEKADSFSKVKGFDKKEATSLIQKKGYKDDEILNAMNAVDKSGKHLGFVITVVSHKGYGGDITFSMGVTDKGVMNGYSITEIHETAGLGMKAASDDQKSDKDFCDQFKGLKVGKLEVVKGTGKKKTDIDAMSGATITSRAMTGGVNAGFEYYKSKLVSGGDKNE